MKTPFKFALLALVLGTTSLMVPTLSWAQKAPVAASPAVKRDPVLAKAELYVDDLGSDALQIIKDTQSGKMEKQEAKVKFRGILNGSFDIPTIARFTLGRYWRVATPAEKQEFTRLLQSVILDKYADRVLEFSGNTYSVGKARAINDRDIGVPMTIVPNDGPPVDFGWRLRRTGNSFKVIDLAVEGISMSVTHRTDFTGVIDRNGGRVGALIDALKNK